MTTVPTEFDAHVAGSRTVLLSPLLSKALCDESSAALSLVDAVAHHGKEVVETCVLSEHHAALLEGIG